MSLKNNTLDSYDFHTRVYDRIEHGNFQKVARLTKKHRSQHSRDWNPDEPQNAPAYDAAEEMAAWKEVQPEIFEMQADFLTDAIVRLRAGDFLNVEGADRLAVKLACDQLTTAMQSQDEEAERSAMVKLRSMLDSRLRGSLKREALSTNGNGKPVYSAAAFRDTLGD